MKLKKAIREHAIAIDALALITLHKRSMNDMGWYDEAIDTDLAYARKEYKRTQRQIRAVMVAMQYRGANKIWYVPQKRIITRLRSEEDVLNAYRRAALMGCTRAASDRYFAKLLEFRAKSQK